MPRDPSRCIDCRRPTEPGTCFCRACSAKLRAQAKEITDLLNDAGVPAGLTDESPEED